jgi:hypothetical protein
VSETPDPELEAALKAVLQVVYKDHPLTANQILVLASELQRLGVHRLVEEHLKKFNYRTGGNPAGGPVDESHEG